MLKTIAEHTYLAKELVVVYVVRVLQLVVLQLVVLQLVVLQLVVLQLTHVTTSARRLLKSSNELTVIVRSVIL